MSRINCGSAILPSIVLLGFLGSLQRLDEEGVMALSDELANRPGLARYSASQRELFFRLLDRGARFGQRRRVRGSARTLGTGGAVPGRTQGLHPQAAIGFDADHHLAGLLGVGTHQLVEPTDAPRVLPVAGVTPIAPRRRPSRGCRGGLRPNRPSSPSPRFGREPTTTRSHGTVPDLGAVVLRARHRRRLRLDAGHLISMRSSGRCRPRRTSAK
jgi:hypothetical protein